VIYFGGSCINKIMDFIMKYIWIVSLLETKLIQLGGTSGSCLVNPSASRYLLTSYFLQQPVTSTSSTVNSAFLPQTDNGLRQLMILISNLAKKSEASKKLSTFISRYSASRSRRPLLFLGPKIKISCYIFPHAKWEANIQKVKGHYKSSLLGQQFNSW